MGFSMKVLGLKDLQAEVDRAAQDVMEQERPAEMAAGEPIRATWAGLVPVDDGNYRDSLTVAWLGKVGAAVGTAWVPSIPREEQPFLYAKRLEFGDSDIHAQPSARPAMASAKQEALAAGAEPLKTVVKGRKPRKKKPTS